MISWSFSGVALSTPAGLHHSYSGDAQFQPVGRKFWSWEFLLSWTNWVSLFYDWDVCTGKGQTNAGMPRRLQRRSMAGPQKGKFSDSAFVAGMVNDRAQLFPSQRSPSWRQEKQQRKRHTRQAKYMYIYSIAPHHLPISNPNLVQFSRNRIRELGVSHFVSWAHLQGILLRQNDGSETPFLSRERSGTDFCQRITGSGQWSLCLANHEDLTFPLCCSTLEDNVSNRCGPHLRLKVVFCVCGVYGTFAHRIQWKLQTQYQVSREIWPNFYPRARHCVCLKTLARTVEMLSLSVHCTFFKRIVTVLFFHPEFAAGLIKCNAIKRSHPPPPSLFAPRQLNTFTTTLTSSCMKLESHHVNTNKTKKLSNSHASSLFDFYAAQGK